MPSTPKKPAKKGPGPKKPPARTKPGAKTRTKRDTATLDDPNPPETEATNEQADPTVTGPKKGLHIEIWPLHEIKQYERNARKIPEAAIAKVAKSLQEFGWRQPMVVDENGVLVVGHARRLAAVHLGWTEGPVHVARDLTPDQIRAYRLMDNRSHQETDWDLDILKPELFDLGGLGIDLTLTGFDLEEIEGLLDGYDFGEEGGLGSGGAGSGSNATLAERFGVPPFSVLDARQGYWQERKRAWLALGIESEIGRGDTGSTSGLAIPGGPTGPNSAWRKGGRNSAPGGSPRPAMDYSNKERGDGRGRKIKMAMHNDPMQGKQSYGDVAAGD